MNYSLTIAGVLVSVVGTSLVQFGFSEGCANEIAALLPVLIGGIVSWYGRVRQGDVSLAGFKN
jgi:hypothetical protein